MFIFTHSLPNSKFRRCVVPLAAAMLLTLWGSPSLFATPRSVPDPRITDPSSPFTDNAVEPTGCSEHVALGKGTLDPRVTDPADLRDRRLDRSTESD